MYTIVSVRKKHIYVVKAERYEDGKVAFSNMFIQSRYCLGEAFMYADLPYRELLHYKKWDLVDGKPHAVKVK